MGAYPETSMNAYMEDSTLAGRRWGYSDGSRATAPNTQSTQGPKYLAGAPKIKVAKKM